MAIACLRLLTFLPLRPLLSVPLLRFFIARSTYLEAPFEYLFAILLLLKQISRGPLQSLSAQLLVTTVNKALFRYQAQVCCKD
jgi:hypothetical protein